MPSGNRRPLIGLRLELDFATSAEVHELLGPEPLTALRAAGVRAAELPIGPETEGATLAASIGRLVGAGLRISLHPYTEGTPFNPAEFEPEREAGDDPCRSFHERVLAVAGEVARLQQAVAVVNVHPAAASRSRSRDELVERSVRFFAWARRHCERRGLAVMPVAEHQVPPRPAEDVQRIGDGYDELLRVITRARVGACWDLGHATLAHRARVGAVPGDEPAPPDRLLRRVAHVHCHDVHGTDHRPLVHGEVPWQRDLELLRRAGFQGTVILEVPASAFLAAGGRAALDRSLEELAAALGRPG